MSNRFRAKFVALSIGKGWLGSIAIDIERNHVYDGSIGYVNFPPFNFPLTRKISQKFSP